MYINTPFSLTHCFKGENLPVTAMRVSCASTSPSTEVNGGNRPELVGNNFPNNFSLILSTYKH